MFKFFKRRKQPEKQYVSLGGEPTPVPPCPVHGRDCGRVPNPFVGPGWLQECRPCPAWEATIERVEYEQQFEQWYDPNAETWTMYPKGAGNV